MRKRKIELRMDVVILGMVIHVAGHADECTEPRLRKTGQDITRLQRDLTSMQKLIDKELTRRYNELTEKGKA